MFDKCSLSMVDNIKYRCYIISLIKNTNRLIMGCWVLGLHNHDHTNFYQTFMDPQSFFHAK